MILKYMRYIYATRIDIIPGEADQMNTVYGIEAVDESSGTVLSSIPDIFTDLREAERVIHLLNEEKLDLIHFSDVVTDIITKIHT